MKFQCKGICTKVYNDVYPSANPNIRFEHVCFSLSSLGFKFCNKCDIHTVKASEFCKFCGSRIVLNGRRFEARQKNRQRKNGAEENIILTADEIVYYSGMIDEKVERKNSMRKEILKNYHL